MCIFTPNWLTLTPKSRIVQFYLKVASYFLSWGKNKYVTLVMRLLWKIHKKVKIGIPEIRTFSTINSKVYWFWSWNFVFVLKRIWVFIRLEKSTTSVWALGNENAIGISYFKLNENFWKWHGICNKISKHFPLLSGTLQYTEDDMRLILWNQTKTIQHFDNLHLSS